ncbi:hypothetical protein HME9304_00501 [Flagellimonas maritima]|uniref:Uncharacterized protein n=1 Tax=Flagellimonas maritima TaxID=1383885 RepID=A0A2Z4LNT2_9FLAO|nr:hypothetical protein HME9304_00501 [Allomuricauda aurantiaca]
MRWDLTQFKKKYHNYNIIIDILKKAILIMVFDLDFHSVF